MMSTPQVWLADLLGRVADTPQSRLADLCRGTGTINRHGESSLTAVLTGGLPIFS